VNLNKLTKLSPGIRTHDIDIIDIAQL